MNARILFISRNMPPLVGGMEKLAHRLHNGLLARYQITLIGPTGCAKFVNPNLRVVELPKNPILFVIFGTLVGLWLSARQRPDICLGANGLIAPVCLLLKKICGIPSIVLVHGLDLVAPNRLYQWLFIPAIKRASHIVANSHSTMEIAIEKGIDSRIIQVINPGVDFPPRPSDSDNIYARLQLSPDAKVILFVGRIVKRKGLSRLIEQCLPAIISNHPEAILLIVGDSPENAALKDYTEATDAQHSIEKHRLESHVKFLGKISDQELNEIYSLADVLVLPLIKTPGDIEGFGMVVLEAASYGVPTVAFDIGGVRDAVLAGKTGYLVTENDYARFSQAVAQSIVEKNRLRKNCIEHAYTNRWENYAARVSDAIAELI